MLVLTRNTSEKILIGDDIEVVVLSSSGGQVKLGIRAPKDVPVHREEVYQQIQQERKYGSAHDTVTDMRSRAGIRKALAAALPPDVTGQFAK